MADLISRNEAREIIADMRGLCRNDVLCDAMAKINALPSMSAVQEPVEPTIGCDADGQCRNWWYQCGSCKEAVCYHDKYCKACGRKVKWE